MVTFSEWNALEFVDGALAQVARKTRIFLRLTHNTIAGHGQNDRILAQTNIPIRVSIFLDVSSFQIRLDI